MDAPRTDAWLAERARTALRVHERFVVAEVRDGTARAATVGLPEGARLEIGSVSKGLTGMLLADAVTRAEVREDTTLGALLPLDGTPAGSLRLGDVATHRSGLPRLPRGWTTSRATVDLLRTGANPYGQSLGELLAAARETRVGRPRPRYSNLGYMLLGHAVAAGAGLPWSDLLRERVTGPLRMAGTTAPVSPHGLDEHDITGTSRFGRTREAWTGEALGPAGGVRCTADDLARLLVGLVERTAPGVTALGARQPFRGPMRVGWAWMTIDVLGADIVWHNGGTGGFRSWVGVDRSARRGVALVSATNRSVDRAGMALLRSEDGR